jgi:histidinol-phosphate aminotransferase
VKTLIWAALTPAERTAALARPAGRSDPALQSAVRTIVDDIRTGGWPALAEHALRLDGEEPRHVPVAEAAAQARASLRPDQIAAIELAHRNVTAFHAGSLPREHVVETMPGLTVRKVWRAIDRVGLYVPGGKTPLFSTLLMLALPAQAAGVGELVVVTPPRPGGGLDPVIALAAELCGIPAIWTVGGAQAIAALAFGAGDLTAVAKICGPGNAWVAEAKTYCASLSGGPAIDMPAGPSELLVIADETADPARVAADLLSQAEHDASAQVVLVTPDAALAQDVARRVAALAADLPAQHDRRGLARARRARSSSPISPRPSPFPTSTPPNISRSPSPTRRADPRHPQRRRDLRRPRRSGDIRRLSRRLQPRPPHGRRGARVERHLGAELPEGDHRAARHRRSRRPHRRPRRRAGAHGRPRSPRPRRRRPPLSGGGTDDHRDVRSRTCTVTKPGNAPVLPRLSGGGGPSSASLMVEGSLLTRLARPEILDLPPVDLAANANDLFGPDAIKLDANENPYPPLVADPLAGDVNRYPEPQPARLRATMAALYGVRPENLVVTRGADDAIEILIRTFCRPAADAVSICTPTFSAYAQFARLQGARVLDVPLNERFYFAPDAFLAAVRDEHSLKLAFICSPNNPTGNLVPAADIIRVADALPDTIVVVDEAYIEFSELPSLAATAAVRDNLVVLRTLSKAYGLAGARVGCAIGTPELIGLISRALPPYPLPTLAISAALSTLSPSRRAVHVQRIAQLKTARDALAVRLAASPVVQSVRNGGGNFLFWRSPTPRRLPPACARSASASASGPTPRPAASASASAPTRRTTPRSPPSASPRRARAPPRRRRARHQGNAHRRVDRPRRPRPAPHRHRRRLLRPHAGSGRRPRRLCAHAGV